MRLMITEFVPETEPLPDEVEAIERANTEITNGEISDLEAIDWDVL